METNQLTFTRFVAAITIVIYHFGNNVFPFNVPFISFFVKQANLGVSYFFVLSGFVMALAYSQKNREIDFNLYIKNRAARILPLYYLALLSMLLYYFIRIKLLSVNSDYTPNFIDIFFNIFLLQNWIPENVHVINTASWTLSVEAFFYILFPLLFNKFYSKFSLKVIAISVIIVFISSQGLFHFLLHQYPSRQSFWLSLPLLHLNVFIAGNLIGLLFIKYKNRFLKDLFFSVLFSVLLMFIVLYFPAKQINYSNGFFIIFQIPILFLIALDKGRLTKLFRKKLMVYLGEISYGIYILQFPVYFFFTATLTFFHYKINQPLFYAYLIILIVVSGISFNYVEKPLREKIKRW